MERSGRNANSSSASTADGGEDARKQMLSPPLRAALGKQGYKLIGVARHRTMIPPFNRSDHSFFWTTFHMQPPARAEGNSATSFPFVMVLMWARVFRECE